jgi:4-amino-4-deoxy-L-arabinose transferase-like glycosyltransferase
VGVGFQAKMLQAWMILPALAVGYLVVAPVPFLRRLWQVGVAGVVMLAVSLSWIALYTFTPASDRPYVDGSTDNSAFAMVFGYNGLERFGITVKGAVTSGPGVTSGGTGAGASPTAARGATGTRDFAGFPGGGAGAGTGAGAPGETGAAGGTVTPGGTEVPGGAGGTGGFPSAGSGGAPTFGGGGGGRSASGSSFGTGWTKLLGSDYGPEIGWLYPLAVLALIFGLIWTRRAKRSDQVRGGFVFWGMWLLTVGLVFSKMSTIPHTAYMSALAAPLAALSAAGIVMFWRAYRAGGWRSWVLPVAVAAELAWAVFLWRDYSGFLPWARDALVGVGAVAIVVMVAARLSRRAQARLATAGLAAGVAAMLAAPGAWAASVLDTTYGGSSFNASAGPAGGMGGGGGGGTPTGGSFTARAERFLEDRVAASDYAAASEDRTAAEFPGASGGIGGGGAGGGITASATTTLTSAEQRLYNYVNAHRDGAGYLMAVGSWEEASPYILATGQEVMDMGGFSGSVPSPTLTAVKALVHSGQLRFFLVSGTGSGGAGFAGGGGGSVSTTIDSWVESACKTVPATAYEATASGSGSGSQTLYACSPSS